VTRELVATVNRTTAARNQAMRDLAADPVIARAVAPRREAAGISDRASTPVSVTREIPEDSVDRSRVAAVLAATTRGIDSTLLGWELWTGDGERRFGNIRGASARDSVMLAALQREAVTSSEVLRSPLYAEGNEVHVWTLAPVLSGPERLGTLAVLRRLNNSAGAERTIRELAGADVDVFYTSVDSREWASPGGTPVAAPFAEAVAEDTTVLVRGADGAALYVVEARVAGTPWRIVLTQTRDSMLGRPAALLRNLVGIGLMLIAAGTLAAWLIGRHIAMPLKRVTEAASALSTGDFAQRVPVTGAREVASLASTFNAMASGLGEANATLAERNTALQRANAAKAQFLATMSHELRTPLNAIGGYVELLELGLRGPVSPVQLEDLARIRRQKDHLLSIIADILSFSRADAGALRVEVVDLPVADVFRSAVATMRPMFDAKGVALEVRDAPAGLAVRADRDKTQQVVLNLLSNALKFTGGGGLVRLSCRSSAEVVWIDVRDTGIGIAPGRHAEIFDPFVQVDGSLTRQVGGTGLGLAIARQLAVAMQGDLTVASAHGEGSTFTLALPRPSTAGMTQDDVPEGVAVAQSPQAGSDAAR
jgi:signal transduction histidine kinase